MRSSFLSRSVVAVATVAVGSVALAAVPASAATTSGVTRDSVLAAAAGVRADREGDTSSPSTQKVLEELVSRSCTVQTGAPTFVSGNPLEDAGSVDGLSVFAAWFTDGSQSPSPTFDNVSVCTFVAVAPTASGLELTGKATVDSAVITLTDDEEEDTGEEEDDGWEDDTLSRIQALTPVFDETTTTYTLSGDVFVTPAVQNATGLVGFSARAAGTATRTDPVFTTEKVADKKSKADKKAARSKYEKRLKAAKSKYAKALDRAGSSATKKAAAKKTYRAARATARAKYAYAIADYKLAKVRSKKTDDRPFSFTIDQGPLG